MSEPHKTESQRMARKYFREGVFAGIVCGILSNFFVAFAMKIIDSGRPELPYWAIALGFFSFTAVLVFALWTLYRAGEKD